MRKTEMGLRGIIKRFTDLPDFTIIENGKVSQIDKLARNPSMIAQKNTQKREKEPS